MLKILRYFSNRTRGIHNDLNFPTNNLPIIGSSFESLYSSKGHGHLQSQVGQRRFVATTSIKMSTQCRQNYHMSCEASVNKQINLELTASYAYFALASYFDRDDVAFDKIANYFRKASLEEREHAEKFVKYQNDRGGRAVFDPIPNPSPMNDPITPINAMMSALTLEKHVNQALLDLHAVASSHNDPHLCDFVETQFLDEQVKAIKQLSDYVTQLKRCGLGMGEYIFDKSFQK